MVALAPGDVAHLVTCGADRLRSRELGVGCTRTLQEIPGSQRGKLAPGAGPITDRRIPVAPAGRPLRPWLVVSAAIFLRDLEHRLQVDGLPQDAKRSDLLGSLRERRDHDERNPL